MHGLVAALLFASPEYAVCQKYVPAARNVTGSEAGTTPLVTVFVPAAFGFAEHMLFVNTV